MEITDGRDGDEAWLNLADPRASRTKRVTRLAEELVGAGNLNPDFARGDDAGSSSFQGAFWWWMGGTTCFRSYGADPSRGSSQTFGPI